MTLMALLFATLAAPVPAAPTVQVIKVGDRWELRRNGKSYFVKGVGGAQNLAELASIGGNSFRTWGAERLESELEEAKKHNLTVCAGIWLGHRRHGFKYDDPKQVADQKAAALAVVRKYKDHPNLLFWGLGNEVELDGDDPATYRAIEEIAKEVKKIDPNHPTMTVVAEVGGNKIERLLSLCPSIDVLGVNSYAGLANMPERLTGAGWKKPFVVTEFGPHGPWEVGKTSWDAPMEPTSSEKAKTYRENWASSIAGHPASLGGYAFLWGNKQEGTSTWFGMMLPTGEMTEAVDVMADAWSKPRKNRSPRILSVSSTVTNRKVPVGTPVSVKVEAVDPDGDRLKYRWVLQAEQTERLTGGDNEKAPPVVASATEAGKPGQVNFPSPTKRGGYRVFVFITDGNGNGATANVPFFVE